jgi:hypothetical protein
LSKPKPADWDLPVPNKHYMSHALTVLLKICKAHKNMTLSNNLSTPRVVHGILSNFFVLFFFMMWHTLRIHTS